MSDPESGVFTRRWAEAWCRAVNEDPDCARWGAAWEGVVSLCAPGGAGPGVALDLHRGRCRRAWAFAAGLPDEVEVAFSAEPDAWDRLLRGNEDPVVGLMRGSLRLERGSLMALLPHMAGARALVSAARRARAALDREEEG